MTLKELHEIYYLLKSHPSEMEKWRELFLSLNGKEGLAVTSPDYPQQINSHGGGDSPILSAKEVGSQLGMGAKWVKERLDLLPQECVSRKESNGKYFITFTPAVEHILTKAKIG